MRTSCRVHYCLLYLLQCLDIRVADNAFPNQEGSQRRSSVGDKIARTVAEPKETIEGRLLVKVKRHSVTLNLGPKSMIKQQRETACNAMTLTG